MLPYANTEAMQEFLDQFAATIGEHEHIVLILDQAGWHGADALRVPANITLVPLRDCLSGGGRRRIAGKSLIA